MSVVVGITGVHRTGKTTLMQALAELLGLHTVQTNVSGVFASMGLRADKQYSLEERMNVQDKVLEHLAECYAAMDSAPFVTDRTPIDLIGYVMADIGPETAANPELSARVLAYVNDCYKLFTRHFSALVVVQPGIKVQAAELKGSLSPAYVEHLNFVMRAAAMDDRSGNAIRMILPATLTDNQERVLRIQDTLIGQIERWDKKMQHVTFH